jgi:PilZ domain
MDRRQHERSEVEAPVIFSWRSLGGIRRGDGTIRNISRGGVFVSTGDPPPVGARIRFRVLFRFFFPDSRLVMQTNARVVRAESIAQPAGFAAALESYTLRNDNEIIERGKP